MCIQKFNVIAILAATCFLLLVETAPLSIQNQLNVALQQLAELKGDGTPDNCCNVSSIYMHFSTVAAFEPTCTHASQVINHSCEAWQ